MLMMHKAQKVALQRGHFFSFLAVSRMVFLTVVCLLANNARGTTAQDELDERAWSGWQRLLHYQQQLDGKSISAIHSKEFFLAENGRQDLRAELNATLKAMLAPVEVGRENDHAKCRFPARRIWLSKHYQYLQADLQEINCPAYSEWLGINQPSSVSVIFASGYLNNPASFYGHILLKLNARKEQQHAYLVDQTVSFGAINTRNDNPAQYIVKAIAGGYDGGFSPIDFFFHNANYREIELRDLWEYELDLPRESVKFIAAHAWEVIQKKYTYYFFHDNCAFRLAELLEIVDGLSVMPKRPWIIPQSVIQEIASAEFQGHPLLLRRVFHPSRQTRLYQRYRNLPEKQQQLVHDVVRKNVALSDPQYAELGLKDKQAVLDTLLDYYQYKKAASDSRNENKSSAEYVEAVTERLSLPPGQGTPFKESAIPPDTSLPPGWLQLGYGQDRGGNSFTSLRLRPAYYDPLDVSPSKTQNSGLSMGDITLEIRNQRIKLTRLDLISVDSMNPAVTGLPGDSGIGWRLRLGWEQARPGCTTCVVGRLQGDYSLGRHFFSQNIFSGVSIGGALQQHNQQEGAGFTRIGINTIIRTPSQSTGVRAGIELRKPFDPDLSSYTVAVVEGRQAIAKNYDLRISWEKGDKQKAMIGLGYYW